MEETTEETRQLVYIGFFDSEADKPTYDDTHSCPVCGFPFAETENRDVVAIMIHCTKFPLATFVRFHKDELPKMTELRYHEIIVDALFERVRLESLRQTKLPDIFKDAFK